MSEEEKLDFLLKKIEGNISEYANRTPLQFYWFKYITPPKQKQLCRKVIVELPSIIEYAKAEFEAGNKNKAISSILYVLEDMFEPIMGQDISWAINTMRDWNRPRSDKESERESIGYTVAVLIFFGSSANQAFDAVSEWLIMSRTKVRDAYYFVRDKGEVVSKEAISDVYQLGRYLWRFTDELVDLRQFPKDYPKAYRAFVRASIFLFEAEHFIERADENSFDIQERRIAYNRLFGMREVSLLGRLAENKFEMILVRASCKNLEDIRQIIV